MKAIIFAAGLGTRLRPLTNDRPKALVEIGGVSLLEVNIRRLKHFGVTDIVINAHHFSEKIISFLKEKKNFGLRIDVSLELEKPLETGGGLKFAAPFFANETAPFFACNADILCDINLRDLYAQHLNSPDALATYAVQDRPTSRYMLHNNAGLLCGWLNNKTHEVRLGSTRSKNLRMKSFSCFHVIEPRIFELMPTDDYFSMIDLYLGLCDSEKICAYEHPNDLWCDVGKPEAIADAEEIVEKLLKNLA
jgi:NDP-sugar pyrophosphorylase family protein